MLSVILDSIWMLAKEKPLDLSWYDLKSSVRLGVVGGSEDASI
jgi:hypothetical protein